MEYSKDTSTSTSVFYQTSNVNKNNIVLRIMGFSLNFYHTRISRDIRVKIKELQI